MLAERVWVMESAEMDTAEVTRRSIERSLAERRALAIVYRSADGEVTKRIVEPIILAGERHWYLVAHCRLRDGIRWFRFDRIERASLTNERYEPMPVDAIGVPPEGARSVVR
jgi:predicted DNA-binding transcriptional regulator YafY